MVNCAIMGCTQRTGKNKIGECTPRLFCIPSIITNQCNETLRLSTARRGLWLSRISRDDLKYRSNLVHTKVCNLHFHQGKPSYLFDETNPDWAPSLNLGHSKLRATHPAIAAGRYQRLKKRHQTKAINQATKERKVLIEQLRLIAEDISRMDEDPLALVKEEGGDLFAVMKQEAWDPLATSTEEADLADTVMTHEAWDEFGTATDVGGSSEVDPLLLPIKEEDVEFPLEYADVPVRWATAADNMTGYNPIKCEVTGRQFSESVASSTEQEIEQEGYLVSKHEELIISDECAFEPEKSDEKAFVVVKREPVDDLFNNQLDDGMSKDNSTEDSTKQNTCTQTSTSVDNGGEPLMPATTGVRRERAEQSEKNRGIKAIKNTANVSSTCCDVCGFRSAQPRYLKAHMLIHTDDKPFQCKVCSYKCKRTDHLKVHMLIHTGDKPFQCKVCSYKCNLSGNLKTHMLIHTDDDKPFQCSACSYKCNRAGDLKAHMLIHTSDKPFQCKLCSYKCKRSGHLKSHMLMHTNDKPFQCSACSYKCNRAGDLKEHMLIHTSDKPFQCKSCSYSFVHASILKRHMLIHTSDRPFQCNACSHKCNRANDLKAHMLIHTGDKPFQCEQCPLKYRCASHLKRHMLIHTGDKPFQCNVCPLKFRQLGNLKRHMLIHAADILVK